MLTTCLQRGMKKVLKEDLVNEIKFYLFGSYIFDSNAEDIDILIVYNQTVISYETIINLKKEIFREVYCMIGIRCDFLTFTFREDSNYNIHKKVKGKLMDF